MMKRVAYTYVLLRYRHDPLAGECVNVGVILHVPAREALLYRFNARYGRIKRLFPDLDADAFKQSVAAIERGVRRLSDAETSGLFADMASAESCAKRVLPADDSSFVWSAEGAGLTADPEATLEQLYERFVTRHHTRK